MKPSIKREVIADGVGFSAIVDPKLKTDVLRVKFITELTEKDAPLNFMASMLIGSTNRKIKTYSEMSDRLNALYGSSIYTDTSKSGDCQFISFTACCIDNRFALDSEDILGELMDIAVDCIFDPNVSGDEFDRTEFELKRRELEESIMAEINNKRSYAMHKAFGHIFKDEPCSYNQFGTLENAAKITSAETLTAYRNLLKTAVIEIYFASPEENGSVKQRFADIFSKLDRAPQDPKFRTVSRVKDEVCHVSDEVEMQQSKVIMAYKSESSNRNACVVLSRMFGGTPFSKLFANVREKMSLCYYCTSTYVYSKGTIIADSGVERENAELLAAEVSNQLDMIKKGGFTDEELMNTKLYIANSVKSVGDTPTGIINWYFSCYCNGETITPEEYTEQIMAITREEVIEAANSFTEDTVYVLAAVPGEEGSEEETDE